MPRPLPLVRQPLVLARLYAGRLDLAHLVAEHVELALAVTSGAAEVVELAGECACACVRLCVGGSERLDLVGDRPVEQIQLALELEEPGVLELAVEGKAPPKRVLHRGGRAQETVHASASPAAAGQLAGHREGIVAVLEERLHESSVGTRTNELFAALLAHQEPDSLGKESLPRSGLACDDVQSGAELEARLGDEHEVVDRELSQHRGGRRASARRSGRKSQPPS